MKKGVDKMRVVSRGTKDYIIKIIKTLSSHLKIRVYVK